MHLTRTLVRYGLWSSTAAASILVIMLGFDSKPTLLAFGGQPGPDTSAYTSQVLPLFQQKCLACHSGAAKMGGLIMDSYDTLMKGGAHGQDIVPGKGD